ncbi:MAG TPA: hypothetical protein DDY37_00560 [Legionella sp.]|nr:hypothetical protein [Legionella sp.]
MLLAGNVFAEEENDGPRNVDIGLYNNSRYNCDLLFHTVIHGVLISPVPAYLSGGSIHKIKMLTSSKRDDASIRLSYICEDDRAIKVRVHFKRKHGVSVVTEETQRIELQVQKGKGFSSHSKVNLTFSMPR